MNILGQIFGALLILSTILLPVSWIVLLVKKIMCSKRENCQIKNCPLRRFCKKAALSPKENEEYEESLQQLRKMISEMNDNDSSNHTDKESQKNLK